MSDSRITWSKWAHGKQWSVGIAVHLRRFALGIVADERGATIAAGFVGVSVYSAKALGRIEA